MNNPSLVKVDSNTKFIQGVSTDKILTVCLIQTLCSHCRVSLLTEYYIITVITLIRVINNTSKIMLKPTSMLAGYSGEAF